MAFGSSYSILNQFSNGVQRVATIALDLLVKSKLIISGGVVNRIGCYTAEFKSGIKRFVS